MAEDIKKGKSKKKVWAFLLLGALAVGAVGGAYAYFTSQTQAARNTFTIAEGDPSDPSRQPGTLDESPWDPDADHTNLQPNELVGKAPKYTHTESWPAIVYMEITVPTVNEADVTANKKQVTSATVPAGIPQVLIDRDFNSDLFDKLTRKDPSLTLKTDADKWSYVGTKYFDGNTQVAHDVDHNKMMYILRYTDVLQTSVQTSPAFENFQVLDYTKYLDDSTEANPLEVDVQVKVVQADGFDTRNDYLVLYNEVFTAEGTDDDAEAAATFTVTLSGAGGP